eukprot:3539763-Amphidinium_carterae.1
MTRMRDRTGLTMTVLCKCKSNRSLKNSNARLSDNESVQGGVSTYSRSLSGPRAALPNLPHIACPEK